MGICQYFVNNRWSEIRLDQHDYDHAIESLQCPSSARDDLGKSQVYMDSMDLCSGFKLSLRFCMEKNTPSGTVRKLNKLLRQAHHSCSRPLVFQLSASPLCGDVLRCVGCTKKRRSQAGYRTCLADAEYLTGQEGPWSLVSWHSARCRRITCSSLSAEVQAAGEEQEKGENVRSCDC